MSGFVQVAGLHDLAEARHCAQAGADAVGLPLRLDHHAPDLTEDQAADLCAAIRRELPALRLALITYEADAEAAADLCRRLGADILQLHGPMEPDQGRRLRERLPDVILMKSLIIGREPAASPERFPWADAFLTDTFDPATGASGATGRTHDWTVSRALAEAESRPVVLAGGLHAGNVARAIAAARPAGVDAHTGLEDADGRKSLEKMTAFVLAAREAFALATPRPFPDARACANRHLLLPWKSGS